MHTFTDWNAEYTIHVSTLEYLYKYVDDVILSLLINSHHLPHIPKSSAILNSSIHYYTQNKYCIQFNKMQILITDIEHTVPYAKLNIDDNNYIVSLFTSEYESHTDLDIVHRSQIFCISNSNNISGIQLFIL